MNIETWLLFFSAYFVVTLSPGPNVLLVVKNAVKYGYKAVLTTIISNLSCQLLIIISIAFGSGALLEKSPKLFLLLKVLGGTYLIYLGVSGLLKKAKVGSDYEIKGTVLKPFSYKKISKEAFIVSSSNPKTVIFLSAFLPQFISVESSVSWQFTIMFLTICGIVTSVHLVYALIVQNINKKWAGIKESPLISKITNSAFIVFGIGVLSSSRTA
jgi:threonine/homoserine/homoserine lactone efflux protein